MEKTFWKGNTRIKLKRNIVERNKRNRIARK